MPRHAVSDDLFPAKPRVAAFLSDLAVHGHVAVATRNQAIKALVCFERDTDRSVIVVAVVTGKAAELAGLLHRPGMILETLVRERPIAGWMPILLDLHYVTPVQS